MGIKLLCFAVLVRLSYLATSVPESLPFLWLPFGASLLFLLVSHRAYWPILISSSFALHVLSGAMLGIETNALIAIAAVESFTVLLAAKIVTHDKPGQIHLGHMGDAIQFAFGVLCAAGIAAALLHFFWLMPETQSGLVAILSWSLALVLSAFVVCGLPLVASSIPLKMQSWRRAAEAALIYASVAGSVIIFGYSDAANLQALYYLQAFLIPLMVWASIRLGPSGTLGATALISILVGFGVIEGNRFGFTPETSLEGMGIQSVLAMLLLVGFPMAVAKSERDRQRELLALELRVFKLMSSEAPLKQVLDVIARGIELQAPFMRAGILLFDHKRQRLLRGASPHLPSELDACLENIDLTPLKGSYGAAIYRKERVIVSDTFVDPLWESVRPLAQQFGLRSCVVQPVLSPLGEVLGVFTLYYEEARYPSSLELQLVDAATSLSAMVLSRYRIERALREADKAYQLLLGSVSGFTFRSTFEKGERRLTAVSPSCKSVLGVSGEELVQMPGGYPACVIEPQAIPTVNAKIAEAIHSGGTFELEYQVKTNLGESRWLWERSQVFRENDSARIEGIVLDVSARKMAEHERARMEEQLRQAQKMEAVGTFAGGIAHDFNNMLGGMSGMAELLRARAENPVEVRAITDQLLKANERARLLIRQLLSFSRKKADERKVCDICSIVEEVANLAKAACPSQVRISQQLPKFLPQLLADETQLHQVLLNLCGNALHAMRAAGGTLQIEVCKQFLSPEKARTLQVSSGNYIRISVIDSGTGMDDETVRRIFEPFFTTKAAGEGTGLGLAVVQGIVQSHKGAIQVESVLGKGTTFRVLLPVYQSSSVIHIQKEDQLPRGEGQQILFLEDEPALIFFGKETLEELGYSVMTFSDGKEALDYFVRDPKKFDLILTDEAMPGMSGLEFVKAVSQVRGDIPIVASSGFYKEEGERAYQALGVKHLLDKPYTTESLAQAVSSALKGKRAAL